MSESIFMPKLGMTMKEGKVLQWMKPEGDELEKGMPVVTIETDKVTYEVDSPASGLLHILVSEGRVCPVGEKIGVVAESREEYLEISSRKIAPSVEAVHLEEEKRPVHAERPLVATMGRRGEVKISPRAKKLAQGHGINVEELDGTGPEGRIVEADVLRAIEVKRGGIPFQVKITPLARAMAQDKGIDLSQVRGSGPSGRIEKRDILEAMPDLARRKVQPEKEQIGLGAVVPVTRMREIIAERLTTSSRDVPHIYFYTQIDATQMIALREAFLEEIQESVGVRLSLTDIVILALARNIEAYPLFNAIWDGKNIRIQTEINIGLAMALEEGLIVPVIRQANQKSLKEIARSRVDLIEKARGKKLILDDLRGSTFTLSNLGGFDVDFFTSIINPPETAILSMARIKKMSVVINDKLEIRPIFNLGLAVDHRVVDGSVAAKFLQDMKRLLVNPYLLFKA